MRNTTGFKVIAAVFVLSFTLVMNGVASSTITWSTASGVVLLDHLGVALVAGQNDTVGYLVQLIYDTGNDGPDAVDITNPYGVSGDDVYVAYAFIGNVGPYQGVFSSTYFTSSTNGAAYYVRTWEGVSSATGSGKIPTLVGDSLYYGNSTNYYIRNSDGEQPGTEDFALQIGYMTDLNAVPEPATIGLAFTAIGLFVIRRFRNKKKDA